MSKPASRLAIAVLSLALACPAQEGSPEEADKFVLEAGEHTLLDLIERSAKFLNRQHLYSQQELGNPVNTTIVLSQRMVLDARGCEEVVGQLLYTKSFGRVTIDKGRGIYEWIAMSGPKRSQLYSMAEYVPVEQIADYRNLLGVTILTTIPLKHINANTAQAQLRPFFAQGGAGGIGLVPGSVGNGRTLLLQGFGPEVYNAYKLLQLVDRQAGDALKREDQDLRQRVAELEAKVAKLEEATKKD